MKIWIEGEDEIAADLDKVAAAIAKKLLEQRTAGMQREARHMAEQMNALSDAAAPPMPVYATLAAYLDDRVAAS